MWICKALPPRPRTRIAAALFFLLAAVTLPPMLAAQAIEPLFTPLTTDVTNRLDEQAKAAIRQSPVRTQTVKAVTHMAINSAAFQQLLVSHPGGTPLFVFNLPGPPQLSHLPISFQVASVRLESDGRLIWEVTATNVGGVTGLLIVNPREKSIIGDIRGRNLIYQIRPARDGAHSIYTVDPTLFPPDHGKLTETDAAIRLVSHGQGPMPEIDVMVLYTPEAARATSNDIHYDIEAAWQALVNSFNSSSGNGVHAKLRKVSERCLEDFRQAPNPDDIVASLKQDSRVTAWRQNDGADLVILWLVGRTGLDCGRTPDLGINAIPIPSTRTSSAFSIVDSSCATGNFSFAHELGHQLGLFHDRETAGAGTDELYNYGFVSPDFSWKTIMAQDPHGCPPNSSRRPYCPRMNWWSDGGRSGKGIINGADNIKALNQNVKVAAEFMRKKLTTIPVRQECSQQ